MKTFNSLNKEMDGPRINLGRRAIIGLSFALLALIIGTGIIIPYFLSSETSQTTWTQIYSAKNVFSDCIDITAKNTEEFIIVSYLDGIWVIGIDMAGTTLWNHSLPDKTLLFTKVILMSDGGVLIVGSIEKSNNRDLYVCLLDTQGLVVWERIYGHPEVFRRYTILFPIVTQTTDGGVLVAAYEQQFIHTGTWLLRLNSTGQPLWNISSYDYPSIEAFALLQLPDEGFALAGRLHGDAGSTDAILLHIDSTGLILWNRTYGGANNDEITSMVLTEDGGFVLSGTTASFGTGNADAWLMRTDSSGNVLWTHTYGGSGSDGIFSMTQTKEGGYALAGYTYSFGSGDEDAWLVYTDPNGTALWNQTYGGVNNDFVRDILQTRDEGFLLLGYTRSFEVEDTGSIWVFKTDKFGHTSQLDPLGPLMLVGWALSLGGAFVLGIIVGNHFHSSRKIKEDSPTNSKDTDSQVP